MTAPLPTPPTVEWTSIDAARLGDLVLRVYVHPSAPCTWQVARSGQARSGERAGPEAGRIVAEGEASNYIHGRRAAVAAAVEAMAAEGGREGAGGEGR